jgi:5'-methylthioadenosine/S-adenosylhomocysteine nucleosidase
MSETYAIFSAMPEELDYLKNVFKHATCEQVQFDEFIFIIYLYKNVKVLLISCGIGTAFSASILTLIYHHFRPKAVLFSGVAGGIDPKLNICDVVIAEKAFEAELFGISQIVKDTPFESCLTHPLNKSVINEFYAADNELLQTSKDISFPDINVYFGNVVTSNQFPTPIELFQKIKNQQPLSIDMETSAFYQVAWLFKIPVLAIRGISNLINANGVDEEIHLSDLTGAAVAAGKVALSILDNLISKLHLSSQDFSFEAKQIIEKFHLKPHPEGGHYARHFTSNLSVKSLDANRYAGESRNAGSAIYYLLSRDEFSAFHMLKSDELWHYYSGSSVKIYVIDEEGKLSSYILGDPSKHAKAKFQVLNPADNWFAAEVVDKNYFSFLGCSVSPGFEFKDFQLADRDELSTQHPTHADIINCFTRMNS